MRGQLQFNYPRNLVSWEKVQKKGMQIKKPENQKIFLEWARNLVSLYQVHMPRSAKVQSLLRVVNNLSAHYSQRLPRIEFHEKSGAWRIARNAAHGGTPWRSECFNSESEAIEFCKKHNLLDIY